MKEITLYTDGACLSNPGKGGWAAILSYGTVVKELSGNDPETTNNRMEMQGVIEGLRALKEPCAVTVLSDSKYIVDNIRGVHIWKQRDWRLKGSNKPVKNRDLWEELDSLCRIHSVTFKWVKGHAGIPGNERADVLAGQRAREL